MVPVVGASLALKGVAVDRLGQLWVAEFQGGAHDGFDRFSGAVANEFKSFVPHGGSGFHFLPGLAVDSKGNLYSGITGPQGIEFIAEFDSGGGVLSGAVDEEESTGVAVELSSDDVYVDNAGTVARFGPKGSLIERFGVPGGHGSGVGVSLLNGRVYVADSSAGVVDVYSLAPPSRPVVVSEGVAKITGDSANLGAELNPEGASSEYWFEYGPCETASTCATSVFQKSAVASVGSAFDFAVYGVSVELQGLLAHTTYHFRVVTRNENDLPGTVVDGQEQTFITQTAGGFALPDGRQWELVSPPDKHSALIQPISERGAIQASAVGSAITFYADAPTEAAQQGYTNEVQVLSTRGPGGWESRDIAIPHSAATGLALGEEEYRFFSEDLSLSVVQPFGGFDPLLSEEASEQTAYLRTDYLGGDVSQPCLPPVIHCYRPLVTGKAGYENVLPGTRFSTEGECPRSNGNVVVRCGPEFLGASPDLSHVVLRSKVGLAKPSVENGLYEWSGGKLALVSVLPGEGGPASGPALGYRDQDARHAISADGSRVVWSAAAGEPHLYMFDKARGAAVQLDTGLVGVPIFQVANRDVSEVFFTDSGDLYDYSVEQGKPVRLTEGANVRGAVLGASEDGSYVYFAATGVLAGNHNASGEVATPGANNLYMLYNSGSGWAATFIAVLSGEDSPDWARGEPENLNQLTARVSPGGRWLAFMSRRSLTGYDNRDAVSGRLDEEVYLYGASMGRVVCASCNPTEARPVGVEYGHVNHGLVGGDRVWSNTAWLAANIPGWTPYAGGRALYQSRFLSDSGRLFFNSNDALVPQDVNGTWDVYQYEPPGIGGCTTSAVTFSERSGGCVGLISSGTSPEESGFLDASEMGGDVFFLTAARLVVQDFDTALDVYDAHECTSVSACFPVLAARPPSCTTEASCKAAPSPQPGIFGAPSSATFSGIGNVSSSMSKPAVAPKRCRKVARHGCKGKKHRAKRGSKGSVRKHRSRRGSVRS
jgi:hypothetical protein